MIEEQKNHDTTNTTDDEFNINLSDDSLNLDVAENETQAHERHANEEKKRKLSLFSRIPVQLTIEVASVEISLSELMAINNDSIIELDKLAGEPLDIKVNGILFGKAEVVVINDKYGVRITELSNKELSEIAL